MLQRRAHYEIQAVLLLLFRRSDIALVLFSVIFMPGVLIHELSHFLTARLLGVRTGRFSLIPQRMADGRLQLGYVETAATDFLRDSLIGVAPLLIGGTVVTYIARSHLNFDQLIWAILNTEPGRLSASLSAVLDAPDFWVWFYLLFTISSTMLPSASDRRAWLPLILTLLSLVILGLLLGVGPWLAENLAPALNSALRALAVVFGVGVGVHLVILAPISMLRLGLSRLMKMEVKAGAS